MCGGLHQQHGSEGMLEAAAFTLQDEGAEEESLPVWLNHTDGFGPFHAEMISSH